LKKKMQRNQPEARDIMSKSKKVHKQEEVE
jgi:hypothetical protein